MYKVFGYDWMCKDYVRYFDSFVKAVKFFKHENQFSPTFMARTGDSTSCLFVK